MLYACACVLSPAMHFAFTTLLVCPNMCLYLPALWDLCAFAFLIPHLLPFHSLPLLTQFPQHTLGTGGWILCCYCIPRCSHACHPHNIYLPRLPSNLHGVVLPPLCPCCLPHACLRALPCSVPAFLVCVPTCSLLPTYPSRLPSSCLLRHTLPPPALPTLVDNVISMIPWLVCGGDSTPSHIPPSHWTCRLPSTCPYPATTLVPLT